MSYGKASFSVWNRVRRLAWQFCYFGLVRWSPRPMHGWRAWVYRCWGADLGSGCHIYPGARVWAPWNLECGPDVCIADGVEVYNTLPMQLGAGVVVSQGAYLCGATHDYLDPDFPLASAPIRVGDRAWIAARAIVLPGVAIGEGCVVGAGSVVTKDLQAWKVCAGNPCRPVKDRAMRESSGAEDRG